MRLVWGLEPRGGLDRLSGMRTCRTLLVVAVVVVTLVVIAGEPASASCISPTIAFSPITVDRGQEVEVTGQGWGDACNDVNVKPGDKVLGRPRRGIEIVFSQGGRDIVVARGAADESYKFRATVRVPDGLQHGTARLFARAGRFESTDQPSRPPLLISNTATGSDPVRVSTFGPTSPSPDASDGLGSTWTISIAVFVAGTVLVGCWTLIRRRRS